MKKDEAIIELGKTAVFIRKVIIGAIIGSIPITIIYFILKFNLLG